MAHTFGSMNNFDRVKQPQDMTYVIVIKGPHPGPKKHEYQAADDCQSPEAKFFRLDPVPEGRGPLLARSSDSPGNPVNHFVFPSKPPTPGPSVNVHEMDAAIMALLQHHRESKGTAASAHYNRYCNGNLLKQKLS